MVVTDNFINNNEVQTYNFISDIKQASLGNKCALCCLIDNTLDCCICRFTDYLICRRYFE